MSGRSRPRYILPVLARSIAVVDDDPEVRAALARLLRTRGFAVRTYGSGEEFLARLPGDPLDCLVLDICLMGMSGLDLRSELLRRNMDTPVVLITAADNPVVLEGFRGADAGTCLFKPIEEAMLVGAITRAIQSRAGG